MVEAVLSHDQIRAQFPMLCAPSHKNLVYLDTGASALKPKMVTDAVIQFYENDYANIHRGVYRLSQEATDAYELVRDQIKSFLNAQSREEIIFTASATASLNLVASSVGKMLQQGDQVIVTQMEHHANWVPWQQVCAQQGAEFIVAPLHPDGTLDMAALTSLITDRTRLIAVAHVANVLGVINPIKQITALAQSRGISVVVDGAQSVARMPVDVQDLGCDFYVFSAHKMYGPTGVGVLYARKRILEKMSPYQYGGDMILTVSKEQTTFNALPYRFEAGTPNIAGVIGTGAAVQFLQKIGLEYIYQHERKLTDYLIASLAAVAHLTVYGPKKNTIAAASFSLSYVHPHDVATVLDDANIAVRAGHHCAMPLVNWLQAPALLRASLGVYNRKADIDALIAALATVQDIFSE